MVDDLLHRRRARDAGCGRRTARRFTRPSVVITTGTFLRGMMHRGDERTAGGRLGEAPAVALSDTLRAPRLSRQCA